MHQPFHMLGATVMKISAPFTSLLLILGMFGQAKAGVIRTFEASGTFQDGEDLSGTVTIDVTAGVVTAVDLDIGWRDLFFTFIQDRGANRFGDYFIQTGTAASGLPIFDIIISGSLVDYLGGPMASSTQTASNGSHS